MMGALLSLVSLIAALVAGRRSLPRGLGVVLAVGYVYGILRANLSDGFSHFMFDAALVGFYAGWLSSKWRHRTADVAKSLQPWVVALMVWPAITIVFSFLMDAQHVLIQTIGYRAAAFMLPLLLAGVRLTSQDWSELSKYVLILNAIAFAFALMEMQLGVERFFPRGPTTLIIYASNDVMGKGGHLRIPSTFSSAHAYAGAMLASLPILLHRYVTVPKGRILTLAVIIFTVAGIFISAARQPVVQLAGILTLTVLSTRLPKRMLTAGVVGLIVIGIAVASSPRLQRFLTLGDREAVEQRVEGSVNGGLLEVLVEFPLGAGLGSAAGTSIPFFLLHYARPQIGLENEYARIALEQGVIGLGLWLAFIAWTLSKFPNRSSRYPLFTARVMWFTVLFAWLSAFIGTGTLTAIPSTVFLCLYMGGLTPARQSAKSMAPGARVGPFATAAIDARTSPVISRRNLGA